MVTDPLTRLAFSIYENRGVYALLVGSGVSRAAQIPTGWEITLNLVRRIAESRGEKFHDDELAPWYRKETGENPNYSKLVGELGSSREERRSILQSYIEPNKEDLDEGRKISTAAHHAIADLVVGGYIRVVITTNFDQLLEGALRARGVAPTVVASLDALKGAQPLSHNPCFLLKLHSDYKDARIRNTEAELSKYSPKITSILKHIFDDYGLIVCGWSGDWDHALRSAIMRSSARRYSAFWAVRGEPTDSAAELIEHQGAQLIRISDADIFFTNVRDHVETLAQTHRRNPRSISLLVESTKRFLSRPEYRIKLDELLSSEVHSLLERFDSADLSLHDNVTEEEFRTRVAIYEAAVEPLARMFGVVGRWGTGDEVENVVEIIRSTKSHADQLNLGNETWLELRTYPAVLLVAFYGIGLVRAKRWEALHRLFSALIEGANPDESARIVERLFLYSWRGGVGGHWGSFDDLERHDAALSDYLCGVFKNWAESFVGVVPNLDQVYETWEVLGCLAFGEQFAVTESNALHVDGKDPAPDFGWLPVGRSGWRPQSRERILKFIQEERTKGDLLKAGFGNGNELFFDALVGHFRHVSARKETEFFFRQVR